MLDGPGSSVFRNYPGDPDKQSVVQVTVSDPSLLTEALGGLEAQLKHFQHGDTKSHSKTPELTYYFIDGHSSNTNGYFYRAW